MKSVVLITTLVVFIFVIGCTHSKTVQNETRTPAANEEITLNPQISDRIGVLFQQVSSSRPKPARPVFVKLHGCAEGTFKIEDNLPAEYQKGLFALKGEKKVLLRISSDTVPTVADAQNSTVGFAIKVFDVPGRKILPGEELAATQDFLLQNHHVFFVDTAQDFLEFTESIFQGDEGFNTYMAAHPNFKKILDDMKKPVTNVLASKYWSTTPYSFGESDHAKYKVEPCQENLAKPEKVNKDPNYLRLRMERDFKVKGACYNLQVQLRKDDMPLDRATVEWSEVMSKPQTVAQITIPPQDITEPSARCEKMSFTGWHAMPEHKPVGTVNLARGAVYKRLSTYRKALPDPRLEAQ